MKKYIAEVIGTFTLVFFGCGSAVFAYDILGVLGVAFAFGLSIVAMAYSIGTISGCHVNPAVSLAMLINRRIDVKDFVGYVISQIVGAFIGIFVIMIIAKAGNIGTGFLGQNEFNGFEVGVVMLIEIVLTFIFVLVIMIVTGKNGNSSLAGIVIGLTLVLVHIVGIRLTGTSVNPARSLAPAVLSTNPKAIEELWVFIVAPFIGSILAAITAMFLGSEK